MDGYADEGMKVNLSRRAVLSGLIALPAAAASIFYAGGAAYADTADELAAAEARLESLGSELSGMQARLADATTELENTDYAIGEKSAQIEEQRVVLADKQTQLGVLMKASYKRGETSLLDFVLSSASFEELVTRVYYLDSISESESAAIEEVRTLAAKLEQDMADLEDQKADQQDQVDSLNAQVSDYQARVAEAREVYDSLDAQLKAEIEARRNAEIQAALEAAERQEQQEAASGGGNSGNNSGGGNNNNDDDGGSHDDGGNDDNDGGGNDEPSGGGSGGHVPSGGGVDAALALIGSPYVWGATGPDSFDCSGLVCYCFGYARGRTTYDMINSLKASGDWKTSMSELNYGDLVFPHSGHVGIYLGGGEMVHASSPGVGVVRGSVYSFYGGGPY